MATATVVEPLTDNTDGSSRGKHSSANRNNASDKIVEVLSNMRGPASLSNRKDYEKRLVTFQASTYYAKPPCLSPLFCARFGWENADKDMLVCSSCTSVLAVTLNSKLSAKTFDKLCHAYRSKIVCNHDANCPFRLSSIEELQSLESAEEESDNIEGENNKGNAEHVHLEVPVYMGQVLPEDSIRLMEYPKPSALLKQKVEKLIEAIHVVSRAINNSTTNKNASGAENDALIWGYPRLQIPSKIRQMDSKSELTKMLGCDDISILALALLGWNPIPNTRVYDSAPTVSLGCPLCLSIMQLVPEQQQKGEGKGTEEDGDVSESDRSTKRQRMTCRSFNPLEAHRHYCPYKVGFPKKSTDTDPVWKIILERLYKEYQDDKIQKCIIIREEAAAVPIGVFDKSIEKVRRILRAGIARKEIDLNA